VTLNPVTCENVPDAGIPTICRISVYQDFPPEVTVTTDNNGTRCEISIDGFVLVEACNVDLFCPCNPHSLNAMGEHTATLRIFDGPGGPAECSETYTIP